MSTARGPQRSRRRGAPLLLLLAILGGLFAMHGLGGHGTAHHTPIAHTAHGAHLAEHVAPAAPAAPVQGAPADAELSGYAALCLALLSVGSILLRRAGHRGLAVLLPRPRVLAALTWPTAARRDRDPPCLAQLSINRC